MELNKLSNNDLILNLEKLVRTERKITHSILLHIAEIEDRMIFAEMGYDGMFTYLTKGLGYSQGAAYRRLHSARLLKQLPEVASKLEKGTLNLTQLSQVQKSIKDQVSGNKELKEQGSKYFQAKALDVLKKIENQNSFETQKTLAVEFNKPVLEYEKVFPQRNSTIRLEVNLTEEQYEALETSKMLLSHICPDGKWSDILAELAERYNQRKLGKKTQSVSATRIQIEIALTLFHF